MPYSNIPPELTNKMENCVADLEGKGHDKDSAIAICYSSVVEGKPIEEAIAAFKKAAEEITAPEPMAEAATIKSRVKAAIKALDDLLGEKDIPELVRKECR